MRFKQLFLTWIPPVPLAQDDFTGQFFRSCWEIVGSDVVRVVQEFFLTGSIHPRLNSNIMALIPKTPTALRVEHYRLIAMSNFVFKVITRILADRLGLICSKKILENQYGFLNGQNGRDAIVGAIECFTDLHKRNYGEVWQLKLIFARLLIRCGGTLFGFFWVILVFQQSSFIASLPLLSRLEFIFRLMGLHVAILVVLRELGKGTLCLIFCLYQQRIF